MKHVIFVISASILGVLAIIVFLANINGKKLFFITDDRMSFITIGVIGLAMCGFGITRNLSGINWISPFNFIAYILGGLAVLIGYMILTGKDVLFIKDYKTASVVLMCIIIAKWVMVFVHDYLDFVRK
jgi:peptidoglycan/LPS O-acetylase OafA/YrhL